MRLIDADAIPWTDLNADMPNTKIKVLITFADKVNRMPTIEERKTGKWIKKDCDLLYCSECDLPSLHPWPYCERCGADMRETP